MTARALARLLVQALVVAAMVAVGRPIRADDGETAVHELATSTDFRVRVNAALIIGRMRPAGALESLERALDDAHPSVRVAVASALGTLGDPSADTSLERRMGEETSRAVKAQIQVALDRLRSGTSPEPPDGRGGDRLGAGIRCVLTIGTMRNGSGVRGDELRRVLADSARIHARSMRGVAVVRDDAPLLREAAARHVPIVTLDGNVTHVTESRVAGSVQEHAAVEFTVRRDQTLKGTVSGAATTFGTSPTLSDESRRRLQDDAVDGAVQSALRGAEQGLIVAAL